MVRFRIPVEVAYDTDIDLVVKVLKDIAENNEHIAKSPAPNVWLTSFEASAIKFELHVWTSELLQRPGYLKSMLNFEIIRALRKNNIEIPFPQREITIKKSDEIVEDEIVESK